MTSNSTNLFLSSLSPENREWLLARSSPISLPRKTSLYEAEQTPDYAYFLTSGLASVVTSMPDGGTAEVGLIGREGVVGSVHLLGPAPVITNCFIQLEGEGRRIPFDDLRKAFRSSEEIRERILEFVQEQALAVSQLAGCQRLHESEERLARWLLMAQDRVEMRVSQLHPGVPRHDARRATYHRHHGGRSSAAQRPDRISPRQR